MSAPQLLHLFSTFAAGGPQVRTATLIHAFGGAFRHTIVSLDGDMGCADRLRAAVGSPDTVAYLDAPRRSWLGANVLRFARLIDRVKPDLVLTYNWGAIEAVVGARTAGVRRLIHAEDGFGPDEARRQLARRVTFRRLVLPLARRVVVPSLVLLDHAERTWKVPARARVHIPNGIDLDHFSPVDEGEAAAREAARARRDELRAQWRVASGELVIGTVARLRAEKGLDLLIDAFAKVASGASSRLVLVGDGPEEARLRELAVARGVADRVVFAGPLADARDALRAFDLFALTSQTEQMPIALIEAMGCGLAVVATDVGDVAEMVAPENRRHVVDVRDARIVAAPIEALLADGVARREIGAANRKKALAEYRLATMVARYRALYDEVLSS